ncbi:hypothetical protein DL89DRAFT_288459 [Linderina pennispora]|uniref:Uncharacterized protein n=1 Tax=Linderina pennispora TaxID=61395 RepID=A0A1Y1VTA6_9FUNG|nr:uncharacterized protein DL89DRAFT_288459 [Linderina pennispora]ORX64245.1 hypothetical protein DL89DRAFT_288459 [Linderina pennispora]
MYAQVVQAAAMEYAVESPEDNKLVHWAMMLPNTFMISTLSASTDVHTEFAFWLYKNETSLRGIFESAGFERQPAVSCNASQYHCTYMCILFAGIERGCDMYTWHTGYSMHVYVHLGAAPANILVSAQGTIWRLRNYSAHVVAAWMSAVRVDCLTFVSSCCLRFTQR